MKNSLKMNLIPIVFLILLAFANCVPTSVLVNTKDSKASNLKVKRSSSLNTQTSAATSGNHKAGSELHLSSGKSEVSLGTRQPSESAMEHKAAPQKRGVNSQLMYSDLFNDGTANMAAGVPNGVWGDELDPALPYSDVQDFDEYQKGSYHRKPYDNLQSILNGEAYPEPFALPLQYPYRYYGDRKKRSNKKGNLDLRLKRESRLTPADMLALVALVEAGERSRQEAENQDALNDYTKSYLSPYNTQLEDENDWSNSWSDTPIDYYGMPYNLDSIPRYEIAKDQRPSSNYYPAKRYMIAKKKRSPGHFLNEPVPHPSISYGGHYGDVFGKGTNKYQKYF